MNSEEVVIYVVETSRLATFAGYATIATIALLAAVAIAYAAIRVWRDEALEEMTLERARAVEDAESLLENFRLKKALVMNEFMHEVEQTSHELYPHASYAERRAFATRVGNRLRETLDRALPTPPETQDPVVSMEPS